MFGLGLAPMPGGNLGLGPWFILDGPPSGLLKLELYEGGGITGLYSIVYWVI